MTVATSCSLRSVLSYLPAKRIITKLPKESLNYVWTQIEYLFCGCEVRLAGLISVSIPISRWHENLEGGMQALVYVAARHSGVVFYVCGAIPQLRNTAHSSPIPFTLMRPL